MKKEKIQFIVLLILGMIFFLTMVKVSLAEDDDEKLTPEQRMNAAADELKDLMDKYENAEIDFIKHEDVNIVDLTGNPKECNMEIYYDNGEVASFSAQGGEFHGSMKYDKPLNKARCIKVYCPCKIAMVTHQQTAGQIQEALEKLKKAMREYLEDKASGVIEEARDKAITHVLDALGIASGPFLTGLKLGMDLGAPFGEMMNKFIEMIFNHVRELDEIYYKEFGDCAPSSGHKRTKPIPGWKDLKWLPWHEDPSLYDTWMIRLDCSQKGDNWVDPITVSPEELMRQKEQELKRAEWEKIRIAEEDAARIKAEDDARRAREEEEDEQRRREWDTYIIGRDAQIKEAAEVLKKDCPMCKELQAAIEQKMKELQSLGPQLADAQKKLGEAQTNYQHAKSEREALERIKDRFDHPSSYISSGDKTVTESDLRAKQWAERELLNKWLNKEMSSQQLEDEWKNFDSEKAKEEYKQELDKTIIEAKAAEATAQAQLQQASVEVSKLQQQLKDLQAAIDALNAKLADCLKLCKEHAVDIIKGTYVMPDTNPNPPKVDTSVSKDSCSDTNQDSIPDTCNDANGDGVIDKVVLIDLGFTKVFKLPGGDAVSKDYLAMGRIGDHVVAFTNTRNRIYLDPVILTNDAMVIVNLRTQNRITIPLTESTAQPPETQSTPTPTSATPPATVSDTPSQMSCGDWCSSKSYSLTQIDQSSYILNYLNQFTCVSGVHIQMPGGISSDRCTCYSTEKPQISVDTTIPVCSTPCGEVPCGSSKSCSCGVRCTMTASCNWGGWKQTGQNAFAVQVGGSSAQSETPTGQVIGYPSITGNVIMHPSGKYWYGG